jgi:hypothetical protein
VFSTAAATTLDFKGGTGGELPTRRAEHAGWCGWWWCAG